MKFDLSGNINVIHRHPDGQDSIKDKLNAILQLLQESKSREIKIMATLEEVLVSVADEATQIGSLSVLTAGIKAQLDAILAGALTPEVQAKVDAVFAGVEANKAAVVAAINQNTDVIVPPVEEPTV